MHCFAHKLIVKFVDILISQQTLSPLILLLVEFEFEFEFEFIVHRNLALVSGFFRFKRVSTSFKGIPKRLLDFEFEQQTKSYSSK